jgi:hypothetical protein
MCARVPTSLRNSLENSGEFQGFPCLDMSGALPQDANTNVVSPSILLTQPGDPTVFGWTIFVLYFVAAYSCFRRRAAVPKVHQHERLIWVFITVSCVILGLNKQLDLQSMLIDMGRDGLRSLDLYEFKRPLQYSFMAALLLGLLAIGVVAVRELRFASVHARTATLGLGIVFAYVLLRASRFQKVALDSTWSESLDASMELTGLTVIIGAGIWKSITAGTKRP